MNPTGPMTSAPAFLQDVRDVQRDQEIILNQQNPLPGEWFRQAEPSAP